MTRNERKRHQMRLYIHSLATKDAILRAVGSAEAATAPLPGVAPSPIVVRGGIEAGGQARRVFNVKDLADMIVASGELPVPVIASQFVRMLEITQVFPANMVYQGRFYWDVRRAAKVLRLAAIYASLGCNEQAFLRSSLTRRIAEGRFLST